VRRMLFRLGMSVIVGAGIAVSGATAANAETSSCAYTSATSAFGAGYRCDVWQTTAYGEAWAGLQYVNSTQRAFGQFANINTGYSLRGWVQRRYNGGDPSTVWGPASIGAAGDASPGWPDPGLYSMRACFQFTSWSGAAIHCTAWY
jgi:hypothetical protein